MGCLHKGSLSSITRVSSFYTFSFLFEAKAGVLICLDFAEGDFPQYVSDRLPMAHGFYMIKVTIEASVLLVIILTLCYLFSSVYGCYYKWP